MKRDFAALQDEFDLLICGGGIYGAWTAYDAALRGLKVALVEQGDWASATSSSSSKLVHGGLRYLETYDFRLVRKALKERRLLLDIAPHRVWPLRFGVPVYDDSRNGMLKLKAGLTLYDALAGFPGEPMRHHHFLKRDFSERFPFLRDGGLKGGFTYGDAQTDDARLVLELVDGAIKLGAVCVNYAKLLEWNIKDGKACGATVQDCINGNSLSVAARECVSSAGPWTAATAQGREWCRLSKGIHLVMPALSRNGQHAAVDADRSPHPNPLPHAGEGANASLRDSGVDEAILLTTRADGRVFFIIPWYGRTLLGTTDTDYRGDIDHVAVEAEEVDYLLAAANDYLKTEWTRTDVIGSYAGLRSMRQSDAAHPSSVSRDWELKTAANGVLYVVGGKLTSSREDAAVIVDKVCALLGKDAACATQDRSLPWKPQRDFAAWSATMMEEALRLGIDAESAGWLLRRHGDRAAQVFRVVQESPQLAARIVPDLPFIHADLVFCAGDEMVIHLPDLLRRRLPLLILAKLDVQALHRLAEVVAPILGWDTERMKREVEACR